MSETRGRPRARRGAPGPWRRTGAWLAAALLPLLLAACRSCPPEWAAEPPRDEAWLYASGSAAAVFVDADARNLALTRAARVLADALGLDVEARLSVVLADDRLFVEAVGADGPRHDLDALELVDAVECNRRQWVLVRLPRP